jgi:ribosomal protein L37AE/L43A
MRTTCPRCGSAETYYNERFKTWRCGKCEHVFTVKGLPATPLWKWLLGG